MITKWGKGTSTHRFRFQCTLLGLLLGGVALCGKLSAQAATPSIPEPQPPYIQLPERAAWVIEFSAAKDKDASANTSAASAPGASPELTLTEVQSQKVGDIKRDVFTYSNGRREEVWYSGKYRFVTVNGGQDAMALDSTMDAMQSLPGDLQYSGGIPAVSWLTEQSYQGPKSINDALCYYFESSKAFGNPKAWIDVKTKLPVQVEMNGITYKFKFGEAPESLELSGIYKKASDRLEALEKSRQRMQQSAR